MAGIQRGRAAAIRSSTYDLNGSSLVARGSRGPYRCACSSRGYRLAVFREPPATWQSRGCRDGMALPRRLEWHVQPASCGPLLSCTTPGLSEPIHVGEIVDTNGIARGPGRRAGASRSVRRCVHPRRVLDEASHPQQHDVGRFARADAEGSRDGTVADAASHHDRIFARAGGRGEVGTST